MSIKIGARSPFLICRYSYNLFIGKSIERRNFLIKPVLFLEKKNKVTDNREGMIANGEQRPDASSSIKCD